MAYIKTVWQDSPSTSTPINAENLNNMEDGIEDVDTRVTAIESAGIVESFNGRNEAVVPADGDYSAEQITYGDSNVGTALDNLASTKANSATTLSGYGITNAYTKTETNNLLADKMSYADNSVLGAKNLLPITLANLKSINTAGTWSDNTYTYLAVDFTVNTDDDGNVTSIVADGTATGGDSLLLLAFRYDGTAFLQDDTSYILSGSPVGSSSTYGLQYSNNTDGAFWDVGSGVEITRYSSSYPNQNINIRIRSGQTVSNLTFYPMIRLATDTDSTFQPYAMTNKELTSKVLDISGKVTIKSLVLSAATVDSNGILTTSLPKTVVPLPSRLTDDNTNQLCIPIWSYNSSGYLMAAFYNLSTKTFVTSSTTVSGTLYYLDLS